MRTGLPPRSCGGHHGRYATTDSQDARSRPRRPMPLWLWQEVQITAMDHRNRCTDLRHPELLATSLLKCPRQGCCETSSETKKIGKLSPLSSFIFDPTTEDRVPRAAFIDGHAISLPENWTTRLSCKPNPCTSWGTFLSWPFRGT
jgi:hypothetical protein